MDNFFLYKVWLTVLCILFIFVLLIVILGNYLLLALEFWIMKDYWLLITILVFTLFLGWLPKECKCNVIYHCQRVVLIAVCCWFISISLNVPTLAWMKRTLICHKRMSDCFLEVSFLCLVGLMKCCFEQIFRQANKYYV